MIEPTYNLGNTYFRKLYNVRYSYVVGSMYKGISSIKMVSSLARQHIMSYFGTGGLSLDTIEFELDKLIADIGYDLPFGANLLCNTSKPELEEQTVNLLLKKRIHKIEASAFSGMTKSIVLYRLRGLEEIQDGSGSVKINNLIQGKISRPEVALKFLKPAPKRILKELLAEGKITEKQAELSQRVPMADCICVESDSGGHTDNAIIQAILPTILRLRDTIVKEYQYQRKIYVGAAGGIGTPEAAASMFMLGADYIQTGSINQCTVEAGTSDLVKDMLQQMNVQDTSMAPAGDMFEIGSKVQVLKKGVFFPLKANKLYEVYKQFNSIEEIDNVTKNYLEEKIFKKTLAVVEQETIQFHSERNPAEIKHMRDNPKIRMARIFQWYFGFSNRIALGGDEKDKTDFQIFCGPALGACNQWLKDTSYHNWRNRRVVELADMIMRGCESYIKERINYLIKEEVALENVSPYYD
jgi:trans-AT polyketide synthase/acyltransferase/oxidoreductase domain-containing protein